MVLVPEPRGAHARAVGLAAEPAARGRVERWLVAVAQQRGGVALHVAAQAVGPRVVVNREPEEWHVADDGADLLFEGALGCADVGAGGAAAAPGREGVPVSPRERRADKQPEDGAAVVAAASAP